jgi:uncharacterized protein
MMPVPKASVLLREARRNAGLSQAELARRAGTTQSVVSAYESASRQPSVPMLARLISAAGLELTMRVDRGPVHQRPQGPLGARLRRHRRRVEQIAGVHGLTNLRVFGSVARGEETDGSDIDLLVEVAPGVGLLGLARCQRELESVLDAPVDLIPAGDLKAGVAPYVLADAAPL